MVMILWVSFVPYKTFPRRIYLSLLLVCVFAFTCRLISINSSNASIIPLQKELSRCYKCFPFMKALTLEMGKNLNISLFNLCTLFSMLYLKNFLFLLLIVSDYLGDID